MHTTRVGRGFLTLVFLVFVAGCVSTPTAALPTRTATRPLATPTLVSAASAPTSVQVPTPTAIGAVTVTDDSNRSVTIPSAPQRIISLAPSTTEIAFALGLGGHIVAVDGFSDYPAEAKRLFRVSNSPLNLEQLVSLKPDIVLAAGITSGDDIRKMVNLNLTVLVVGAAKANFDNIAASITMVGKATRAESSAKTVTDAMKLKLDALQHKIAGAESMPRVYWELDATDAGKPFTPGPGSFVNDIIAMAGGANVTAGAKTPYSQISAKEIIAADPELIILSDFAYGVTIESVKARQGWSVISAVKNDKIFPIDDNLVSRPGPRIVDGLEAAAKLIHPELFR